MDGITLLINIHNVDERLCQDEKILKLLLIRCVEAVELTPVHRSLHMYQFPAIIEGRVSGDFGISGGMILLESHIYLHTWPEKHFIRLELSSCKQICRIPVEQTIRTILGKCVDVKIKSISWQNVENPSTEG